MQSRCEQSSCRLKLLLEARQLEGFELNRADIPVENAPQTAPYASKAIPHEDEECSWPTLSLLRWKKPSWSHPQSVKMPIQQRSYFLADGNSPCSPSQPPSPPSGPAWSWPIRRQHWAPTSLADRKHSLFGLGQQERKEEASTTQDQILPGSKDQHPQKN